MRQVKMLISCGALSAVVQAASDDLTPNQRFHRNLNKFQKNIDDRVPARPLRRRRNAKPKIVTKLHEGWMKEFKQHMKDPKDREYNLGKLRDQLSDAAVTINFFQSQMLEHVCEILDSGVRMSRQSRGEWEDRRQNLYRIEEGLDFCHNDVVLAWLGEYLESGSSCAEIVRKVEVEEDKKWDYLEMEQEGRAWLNDKARICAFKKQMDKPIYLKQLNTSRSSLKARIKEGLESGKDSMVLTWLGKYQELNFREESFNKIVSEADELHKAMQPFLKLEAKGRDFLRRISVERKICKLKECIVRQSERKDAKYIHNLRENVDKLLNSRDETFYAWMGQYLDDEGAFKHVQQTVCELYVNARGEYDELVKKGQEYMSCM